MALSLLALLASIGRSPMGNLRVRLGPLTAAVIGYSAVCLASGLWSHFGSNAGQETAKLLTALAVFALLLFRWPQGHIRNLLAAFTCALSVIALLCIDASATQLLTRAFIWLMRPLSGAYDLADIGYEAGVRITGIYSNGNVSAGLLAFGLLVSLYLLRTAPSERARLGSAIALGIQALAFFLSFSMGAMIAFAASCLVYVLCAGKGGRLSLFLLMLECVAATLVCAFGAYPFLGASGAAAILPELLAPLCGAAIWAMDRFIGRRLLAALTGKDRVVGMAAGVLAALAALYVLLAFRVTGGASLDGGVLSRAVYPDAGTYTVSFEGADANVLIYSQNEAELMMHTNTPLYEGPLSAASFTVPEDSRVVWFQLSGTGGLDSLSLSDGTKVPLGYRLLPGFAANRLQGLRANQNAIQRFVFFRDGIALWKTSPVVGWGIGGVQGQVTAVQQFYYESKYVHNHFIQVMAEVGLLGLAAFLFLLGSAVWTLVRRRKDGPLIPALAACLTMMIVHGLTEVVWSSRPYQTAVVILFFAMLPETEKRGGWRLWCTAGTLWVSIGLFALLMAGNVAAAWRFHHLSQREDVAVEEFIAVMKSLDALDVYDDMDYQVNLMGNALQLGGTENLSTAARCARELRNRQEYDSCYYAAAYYYLPVRDLNAFFDTVRSGLRQERSNPDAWNSAFHLFAQARQQMDNEEDRAAFDDGVRGVLRMMEEANEYLMADVTLDEANAGLAAQIG